MTKAIRDDKVCIVAENLEEAKSLINALVNVQPFYTEHQGEVIEIKGIKNESVTIIFEADVRVVEGVKL